MAQTINTNVMSLNAQRNLSSTQSSLATTMQRLSSGLRVNSARDDSAGLAIAERMSAQVRGMNVGIRNANDAVSLAQTAEGALGRITDNLQRMRELAVQSANGSNSEDDRANLNTEYVELADEVERVLNNTVFSSSTYLLNAEATLTFQVGANNTGVDKVDIDTTDLRAGTGMAAVLAGADAAGIGGDSTAGALAAMDNLDDAIDEITSSRAKFGAAANRFESVIGALQTSSENAAASRGRIVDADFAVETANLSRTQILQQAGSAMLAQANQMPQMVMNLLR
jgi:flagellin